MFLTLARKGRKFLTKILLFLLYSLWTLTTAGVSRQPLAAQIPDVNDRLSTLTKDQVIADFRVANLYSDSGGRVVGIKLRHIPTDASVFLLRIETVPQAFIWVDTPDKSNRGLPHSLEHLLESKGTKGRYFKLLKDMRLSRAAAATTDDFNYYGFASGSGLDGFFELLHASLDALFDPDFTDIEAEREFYHFGVAADPGTNKKRLIEQGSVYDEMETGQGSYQYYFELNKRVLGGQNPFSFYSSGIPDEMRDVTPDEIKDFHSRYYRLGSGTGFIFVLDLAENAFDFLHRVSQEFKPLPAWKSLSDLTSVAKPKYPIDPSSKNDIVLYPFPGASDTDPGEVRFSWRPTLIDSAADLKLLQLFFSALAGGERSLLYRAVVDSKTREIDSGASTVESEPFLANSPNFPVWNVGISGAPGDRISVQRVSDLRNLILRKIREVSEYTDDSGALQSFNKLVMSYALAWRRTENVWVNEAPDFGVRNAGSAWKDQLEALEMDASFNRSISEEAIWQAVDHQLSSGKNIWRPLIQKSRLLDLPYGTASTPSPQLLKQFEHDKENRIRQKLESLLAQYHTTDEQEALTQFELAEQKKTREMDQIEKTVRRPQFTNHPPLTWDDSIHYREFTLPHHIPVVAAIFNRPPTIDVGLSFDLRRIPEKYYKYLPLLPKIFDSLGTKNGNAVLSYQQLLSEIRTTVYTLSVSYEFDALSKRADLAFRTSGANITEFRKALQLLRRIMWSNYLDLSNVDRLRDIVDQRLFYDDSFTKQSEEYWIPNPAYSFLHQDDPLFFSLNSEFTWAHWVWRLKWLLHKPVDSKDIGKLGLFARVVLASSVGDSRQGFTEKLEKLDAKGLEKELVNYWYRNLSSLPDKERVVLLQRMTDEVQEDLRTGPAKTIEELKQLQSMVLNRRALRINLTLSQEILNEIQPDLVGFLETIPARRPSDRNSTSTANFRSPVIASLARRYHLPAEPFPFQVGFVNPDSVTGNVIFYSDSRGYSRLDHESMVEGLAKNLLSGLGPQSLHMKASEIGLAYNSSLTNDPSEEYTWYYADRVADIPALVQVVNGAAEQIPNLKDPFLVDYALRQTFVVPRSMNTLSQRGWAIAQDIWNGNSPQRIKRFSKSILSLRRDDHLLLQLTNAGFDAVCGVLLDDKCTSRQNAAHSLFFFIGSEKVLNDTEHRLSIPGLVRVWPSDYWLP